MWNKFNFWHIPGAIKWDGCFVLELVNHKFWNLSMAWMPWFWFCYFSTMALQSFYRLMPQSILRNDFNYCVNHNINEMFNFLRKMYAYLPFLQYMGIFYNTGSKSMFQTSNVDLCVIVVIECVQHTVVVSLNYISLMMTLGHYSIFKSVPWSI